jgi:hypothetical protein
LSQKNFKVKNGLSVNGTEVIDANAQVDWTRLKNRVSATTAAAGEMAASDKSKLDGIENNATADQSPSEIRTAVASASDSNVFTDAQQTKLNNISTSADVTPIIDEDSMASNLATSVPSQQSTKAYVDAQVNGLVDAAPGTLNTLNELAAALGDDANYATTVNNNIASKLPLAGGTLTGNIVMSGAQTVDGRDVSVDGTKLDGIATSADVTDTTNVVAALTAGTNVAISAGGTISSTDTNTTYSVGDGGLTQVNFTTADNTKLDGIEASANNYSPPQAIATSSNVTFNDVTVSGTLTETSAAIYKENINPLASQLANVMALRPVEYDKKATGEHEIGLIAGEVEKVLPDFVQMKNGVADSLNYSRMVSVLVKAVQELTEKVEKLSK